MAALKARESGGDSRRSQTSGSSGEATTAKDNDGASEKPGAVGDSVAKTRLSEFVRHAEDRSTDVQRIANETKRATGEMAQFFGNMA